MICPEQNKNDAAQDKAYCEHLSCHSNSGLGYLMMLVALDSVYAAMGEPTSEDRREAGRILPSNPDDKGD